MKSLFGNIITPTASYTYGQAGRLGSATIGTTPVKYDRNGHPEKVSLDDETWIAYDYDIRFTGSSADYGVYGVYDDMFRYNKCPTDSSYRKDCALFMDYYKEEKTKPQNNVPIDYVRGTVAFPMRLKRLLNIND